jgi:hypothetical protein
VGYDEVTGGLTKLHNEELRDLYSSPSIIRILKTRRMRWAGHVARMGEKRNAYRLLVGKPEGIVGIVLCSFRYKYYYLAPHQALTLITTERH